MTVYWQIWVLFSARIIAHDCVTLWVYIFVTFCDTMTHISDTFVTQWTPISDIVCSYLWHWVTLSWHRALIAHPPIIYPGWHRHPVGKRSWFRPSPLSNTFSQIFCVICVLCDLALVWHWHSEYWGGRLPKYKDQRSIQTTFWYYVAFWNLCDFHS